jgi:hypothetical protein
VSNLNLKTLKTFQTQTVTTLNPDFEKPTPRKTLKNPLKAFFLEPLKLKKMKTL